MALEALLGSALATDPSKNLVFRQFLRCSCLFVLNCDQFGINVGTLMALVFGAFGTQKKTHDSEPKGLAAEAILRQFCWGFMSPRCLRTLGHLLPGPAGCAQRLNPPTLVRHLKPHSYLSVPGRVSLPYPPAGRAHSTGRTP